MKSYVCKIKIDFRAIYIKLCQSGEICYWVFLVCISSEFGTFRKCSLFFSFGSSYSCLGAGVSSLVAMDSTSWFFFFYPGAWGCILRGFCVVCTVYIWCRSTGCRVHGCHMDCCNILIRSLSSTSTSLVWQYFGCMQAWDLTVCSLLVVVVCGIEASPLTNIDYWGTIPMFGL